MPEASAQPDPPIILEPTAFITDPIVPYLTDMTGQPLDGQGLCMMTAFSTDGDFNATENNFVNNANLFFESQGDPPNNVVDVRTVRTVLDFANADPLDSDLDGDFVDSDPLNCPNPDGCAFFPDACPPNWTAPDASNLCNGMPPVTPDIRITSPIYSEYADFGSRMRGFLNVPPDWVGMYVNFGLYVDHAAAIVIWNGNGVPYPVIIRRACCGIDKWISTNSVVFQESGIYAVEIIYYRSYAGAMFELSYLLSTDDSLRDESDAGTWPQAAFSTQGYQLFPKEMFFQTLTGRQSFPSVDQCQQCPRYDVNIPGADSCDSGYYCNEAALCAPCDTALFCGLACLPCGGTTPYCGDPGAGFTCVECLLDEDCQAGFSCDPTTLTCNECNVDEDCPRGDSCVDHACVPCDSADSCSGNSCNCCPKGADGAQLECEPLVAGQDPVCVECTSDAECATGVCDLTIGRCVERLFANERPDCCGPNCLECPGDHPFCLPGQLGTACAECRWDTDCGDGLFCQSGECVACDDDRRCGARCESCAGDTPYCKGNTQMPELSTCVECERDADCASGACDLATNTCTPAFSCAAPGCGGATPYCFGDTCVECYADVHCPCGGVCDRSSNTCEDSCRSSDDCLGYEHCTPSVDTAEKVCKIGPSVVQSPCGALASNCISFGCSISAAPADEGRSLGGLLLALAALVVVSRSRRRGGIPCR